MNGDLFEILFGIVVVLVLVGRGIKALLEQQQTRHEDGETASDYGWEEVSPTQTSPGPIASTPPPVPQTPSPSSTKTRQQPWAEVTAATPPPTPPPHAAAYQRQDQEPQASPEPPSVERFVGQPEIKGVSGLAGAFSAPPRPWGKVSTMRSGHMRVQIHGRQDLRRAVILREILDHPRAFDL
ncbi:MAG: hypothetical protein K9N51_07565 [Candidatus Pacebacteria bacterium]|nr:hypothetical protein [Candidatus Paceibacterota bacterium]